MRLLNEHMPIPEMHPSALKEKALSRPQSLEKPKTEKEADTTENRNLHLARQVQEHKTKLIQELSRLPLTAFWLISKYSQDSVSHENDDDSGQNSDIQELIKTIKADFDQISALKNNQANSTHQLIRYSRLESTLAQFPYAFDDLVTMVDLTIREAKLASGSLSPASRLERKDAEIVNKRFNGELSWLSKRDPKQLVARGTYNVGFLLKSLEGLDERLSSIILAEKKWLSSRQLLASANAKLVLFIANQYKGNFLDFEDLVQEGNTGLLKAVDRYKYQLGFQFSTYAGYWIRQAISRALSRSERVVRIPCGQIAVINRVFRLKDELTLKLGKEPDTKQLAEAAGLNQDEINNILEISQTSVALESFDDDEDESFAPIDFLEQKVFTHCSETIAKNQLENIVSAAIKTLNPREAKIISSHFGVGTGQQSTLQEIGSELNLTRERVRQIQVVALSKIRSRYGDLLFSFL